MDSSPAPEEPKPYFPPQPPMDSRSRFNAGFVLGWLFFLLAFAAAAAEKAASDGSPFTSLYKVWYSLRPGSLIVVQILVEKHLHPWVWNPLLTSLLALPGWFLFGLPSGLLLWLFRPHKSPEAWAEEDSYSTYDRLAKAAAEEGATPDDPRWQEIPPIDAESAAPSRADMEPGPENAPPADLGADGRASSDGGRAPEAKAPDPTR